MLLDPNQTIVLHRNNEELARVTNVDLGGGEFRLSMSTAKGVTVSDGLFPFLDESQAMDQVSDFCPILSPPIIPREVVMAKTVLDVFQKAFLPAEFDYEGDVLVSLHGGLSVGVLVVTGGPYLKFVLSFALRADADELLKLRMVNRLNRMTNDLFTIPHLETLIAVRFFQYPNGLVPYLLVEAVQNFAQDIRNSLARNDDDAIVCDLPPEWPV